MPNPLPQRRSGKPPHPDEWLPRNIILAGFMGTGKTAVGKHLAKHLGWKFVDADDLIEQHAGRKISEIFADDGEAAFREIEAEVARGLARLERHVIATGGGMVISQANRRALKRAGALILLQAEEETIWRRVRHARHRPLLAGPDPRARVRELMDARREAYGRIRLRIPTDDRTVAEVAEAILQAIR